jgi:uncharacterized protein (DUF1015 family)
MAKIIPFRAFRYNSQKTDPARVLTQPYDKITPEMQRRYAAASPYNLITVEKSIAQPSDSPTNNVYTRAAQALDRWIAQQILVQDPEPSLYVYSQSFEVPSTHDRLTRTGLIALGHLEDYSAKIVFRHEQTLSGPKADRLELLRHTRAHTGQLFMLYDDPSRATDELLTNSSQSQPDTHLTDEFGVEHRLWRVSNPHVIAQFQSALSDKKLVIADGHHRYETALAYRDERRVSSGPNARPDVPWEFVMMTLVNARSEGLVILPTHRLIFGLTNFSIENLQARMAPFFEVTKRDLPASDRGIAVRSLLTDAARKSPAIGLYAGRDAFLLLTVKPTADITTALPNVSAGQRSLDVVLLHELIFKQGLGITAEDVRAEKHTRYERDPAAAMSAVEESRAQSAFLLNPIAVSQVMDLATSGEVLPQKSTDFYPKLLSGSTIYRLEA